MKTSRHGFTMIEVLVALAIFALAGVVLATAYINVLTAYNRAALASDRNNDVTFARATALAEPDRDTVEKGGDFDAADGRRLKWAVQIEPTSTADLFTVHFQCELSSSGDRPAEKVSETFRVLRPTWSTPEEREKLRAEAKQRIEKLKTKLSNS